MDKKTSEMREPLPSERQNVLVLSSRPWNSAMANRLNLRLDQKVQIISSPAKLRLEVVAEIDPQWIFVPHWSHLIPQSIWGSWRTVIFHMTDLPYGRGGSPLQNLIQRGHSSTMLTALRCCEGLDTGDIYFKQQYSQIQAEIRQSKLLLRVGLSRLSLFQACALGRAS